jgi:hypothetical protein
MDGLVLRGAGRNVNVRQQTGGRELPRSVVFAQRAAETIAWKIIQTLVVCSKFGRSEMHGTMSLA